MVAAASALAARSSRLPGFYRLSVAQRRAVVASWAALSAEEVAEFIDSLESGGPPSAVRWLADYLESIRAIYAIRIYPEAIRTHPEALDAVDAVRNALRDAVGGIGQWDHHGFTNEDDRLIWCSPEMDLRGTTRAAMLDESTGDWIPFELDLNDPDEVSAFIAGNHPRGRRHSAPHHSS